MSQIKSILVVGGGSAGWMTATYLHSLNKFDVSLVESNNVPIVGVGESTIPSINDFLAQVGVTEEDLFEHCSAVRKYGIQHNDWREPENSWMHMFVEHERDLPEQFAWMESYTKPTKHYRHAYHLDAAALAPFLRDKIGIPRGIKHYYDDIEHVIVDNEQVLEIQGRERNYQADLYIDCTGFRSIVRSVLGGSFKQHQGLVNNCAIAGPGVYAPGEEPLPYTQTYRTDHGWRWRICLKDRTGNGYVFNDQDIDIETARAKFIAETPGLIADKTFVVRYHNQYNSEPYKNNVLAIGLSCGFLEPLEATGLFLAHGMVSLFARLVDSSRSQEKFNRIWNATYQDIGLFLEKFYKTSTANNNSYWQQFNKITEISVPKTQYIFKDYNYRMLSKGVGLPLVKYG